MEATCAGKAQLSTNTPLDILRVNEHRLRDKALSILGQYTYEDSQQDGFQNRVRVDLKKGFSVVLKKYRSGESDLIRNIYFTQFVVQ